jgi:hypothetical protein
MAGIRPFTETDVPVVADLIWKVLHERPGSSPSSLQEYLQRLFLRNPWVEPDIVSLVSEGTDGKIVGFFGVVPRRMIVRGKSVRMAFGSNFVVDPESRASMAGMQLVRTFMKGPQDVSITDSANEGARQLLRSLGFSIVPIYSLVWARPLRPTLYGLHGVARLKKSKAITSAAAVAKPLCQVFDSLAAKLAISPFHQSGQKTASEELTTPNLVQCLAGLPGKNWMLPEYTADTLNWVLKFLEDRNAFGELRKILLRDSSGKAIGWYIYGLRPGGIGDVLQLGAEGTSIGKVLDHLFHDAWQQKLIGLHGRLEPQFMEELTRRSCFFLRNGSWTLAHSNNQPELPAMLQSGNAFFSRLDGEWSLRFGVGQY